MAVESVFNQLGGVGRFEDAMKKWSVASVFNEWGVGRFEDAYDYGRGIAHISQTYGHVTQVADCIRELSYQVDIEQSLLTGVFVIISISKMEDNGERTYYYGVNKSTDSEVSSEGIFRTLRDGSFSSEKLPLIGRRTIYQKVFEKHCSQVMASKYYKNFPKYIQNVSEIFDIHFSEHDMKRCIDSGSHCHQESEQKCFYNVEGVSTIGNTLPNDIVNALRDFRSDTRDFTTEPDYEFYIPDTMCETTACPVSEMSVDEPLHTMENVRNVSATSQPLLENHSSDSDDEL
jgi:hypothetical protein